MAAATGAAGGLATVVGVAAGESAAVSRSMDFLELHTPQPFTVLRLHHPGAIGFNELIERDGDLVVLLEAGALVGPRWLELLTAAMARTGAGLAGPSTNRAWNEQGCVTPSAPRLRAEPGSDQVKAVRRDAMLLLRRFGSAVRTLAPLYSLSDFCYAVRREVIDAIGPADPAYGDGPCWEMDYNIHASRAGFEGIWVGGAYVCRTAMTPRRSPELLQRNRELYQDRFCGRRLRGDTEAYEPHCRGAACADFAPRELITLRPTLPPLHPDAALPAPAPSTPSEPSPVIATPRTPLVSCVMPTRDRPEFAARAARYFLGQDYPNAELVVVDDGGDLAARLPSDPRIRVVRSDRASRKGRDTIGALRNTGTAAADGEIIVCWDDDDWHGPSRVSDQVGPILAGVADLSGLADVAWFEPATGRAWRLTPELHRRLLCQGIYGGTIAFHRSLWRRFPFPDQSLAEDAQFVARAVRSGARLLRLSGDGRYVYIRHEQNSWRLTPGQAVLRAGWTAVPAPALPPGDRAFYADLARPGSQVEANPLVSCIMPTRNRRAYVARAIEYFLRQDYPAKELVILDDGDDPIGDLVPEVTGIGYHRLEHRTVLGAKRNLACELASGALIAHWDDDDWQAPRRLSIQESRLIGGGADLCGAGSLLFWDPQGNRAWRYSWPTGRRGWVAGTSLCYPRSLWQRTPFSEVPTGEDTRFVWQSAVRRLADVRDENCVVGLVHPANTVPKTGRGRYWARVDTSEVTRCLGSDVKYYQGLGPTPQVASAASG